MHLRKYRPEDCQEIIRLFQQTVHTINAKDYTEEQLDAWAPEEINAEEWNRSLSSHCTIVAVEEDHIAGFGDIDDSGYLDHLFVSVQDQRKGIASAICDALEKTCEGVIVTEASITARGFFEKRGYAVIREQEVKRRGVILKNFRMEKR